MQLVDEARWAVGFGRSRLHELRRRSQIVACHIRREQLDQHTVLDPEFDYVETAARKFERPPTVFASDCVDMLDFVITICLAL